MSATQIDKIISILSTQSKPYNWVLDEFSKIEEFKGLEFDLEMLELMGLGLFLDKNNNLSLKTRTTNIKNEIFCVVDIESTGGLKNGKILEIGAVKIQNLREIARFNRLIKVREIPQVITDLTGINLKMLAQAQTQDQVLREFRLFLKDSIFVAHNVKFDYNFISKALFECGFGLLLNRKICTIEFAKCHIESQYYRLEALKEILNIKNQHHRALNDALAATEIFKYCLSRLPSHIKTTEELISHTKTASLKQK